MSRRSRSITVSYELVSSHSGGMGIVLCYEDVGISSAFRPDALVKLTLSQLSIPLLALLPPLAQCLSVESPAPEIQNI